MLLFPFAKINLGLHVMAERPDGYHEIQSIMVPIPLSDALEAVVDEDLGPGQIRMSHSGITIPGDPLKDLCLKAVNWIAERRSLPGLRLHLHKVIPIGAGLGGGSSDGAHMLLLLDRLLGLGLSRSELQQAAESLGSDPPFFLERRVQLSEGRGEQLTPLSNTLKGLWMVLVNPGIHIGTSEVYRNCTVDPTDRHLAHAFVTRDWTVLTNDLEPFVLAHYPAVQAIKRQLMGAGAVYTAMSGSGSSVFGLFEDRPVVPAFPQSHHTWTFAM